jgi:D-glycero-alpha-D-manno-heptose 1-phosphate guanylyltransferase
MEAIVLAGGFGTRLREVVPDLPKPMAPIAGRPFLEILLHELASKGFQRVILSLGFMADSISAFFGDHFAGMTIVSVVETRPLGTGGGVRLAMDFVESDHVYIFNGDTFLDLEISLVEALWQSRKDSILVARSVPDTARYGRLLVEGDQVRGFLEKGAAGPGLINAGAYLLDLRDLASWPEGIKFSLEHDYLVPAVTTREINCYADTQNFIDIGIPDDYFRAEAVIVRRV